MMREDKSYEIFIVINNNFNCQPFWASTFRLLHIRLYWLYATENNTILKYK